LMLSVNVSALAWASPVWNPSPDAGPNDDPNAATATTRNEARSTDRPDGDRRAEPARRRCDPTRSDPRTSPSTTPSPDIVALADADLRRHPRDISPTAGRNSSARVGSNHPTLGEMPPVRPWMPVAEGRGGFNGAVLFPTMTFAIFFAIVLGVSWRIADRP